MARSAASDDGRYTEEQVMACVHADVANRPDFRLEVYDRAGHLTDIEPVVKECYVEFDADRTIHGSLTLVMEPVEMMRDALYQYVVSPLVGIGPMPDGGTAWHRWGKYLWTRPTADVSGVRSSDDLEDWAITLGDLNHLLNLNGVGLVGFVVDQDWLVTTAIQWAAMRAGESDLSRIEVSDTQLTESINWTMYGGPRASRRIPNAEYAQTYAAWQAVIKANAKARKKSKSSEPEDPPAPPRVATRDLEEKGIRWIDVLDVLDRLIGYNPPWRDMQGRLVANAAPNLAVDTPRISYRTDLSHVILPPFGIEPDVSGIANIVYAQGSSDIGESTVAITGYADLDLLLPDHPLAPRNAKVRIEDVVSAVQPTTQAAADAQARAELFASLNGYETITFDGPLNPQHEGFELLALQIDRHPHFSIAQVVSEKVWRADLIRGRMAHKCARAFRPLQASPTGPLPLQPQSMSISPAAAAWSARAVSITTVGNTVNISPISRTWTAQAIGPPYQALVVSVLGSSSTTTGTDPIVTTSMNPTANRTYLLGIHTYTSPAVTVNSCTGWGLTWTRVDHRELSELGFAVFRAHSVSDPTTGTLSIDLSGAPNGHGWTLLEVEHIDGTTNDGVVQSAGVIDTADSNTATLGAFGKSQNGVIAFLAAEDHDTSSTVDLTQGSGYTAIGEVLYGSNNRKGFMWEYRTDNDTSVDGSTTAASDTFGIIAMEMNA